MPVPRENKGLSTNINILKHRDYIALLNSPVVFNSLYIAKLIYFFRVDFTLFYITFPSNVSWIDMGASISWYTYSSMIGTTNTVSGCSCSRIRARVVLSHSPNYKLVIDTLRVAWVNDQSIRFATLTLNCTPHSTVHKHRATTLLFHKCHYSMQQSSIIFFLAIICSKLLSV